MLGSKCAPKLAVVYESDMAYDYELQEAASGSGENFTKGESMHASLHIREMARLIKSFELWRLGLELGREEFN